MSAAQKGPIILHADQEHSGLRLAIFIAFLIGLLVGFQLVVWLLRRFAPSSLIDYSVFLACIGAVPLALLLIWGLEGVLKRYWHSGLTLTLDHHGITVDDRRPGQTPAVSPDAPAILWDKNLSQLNWYFRLSGYPRGGRERRVSAKWLCLATELQQDGGRLSVYTFMPPNQAQSWIENPRLLFTRLNPAEVYTSSVRTRFGPPSRPNIPNSVLHAKEGRYWLAERRRWEYGIELTPEDFAKLMEYAQAAGAQDPTGSTDVASFSTV